MKPVLLASILLVSIATRTFAHCEIPCGIYDDSLRINLLHEHIGTIEKSMITIGKLSKEKPLNYNQIVRWVTNKENHAEKFQEIICQYFLNQRIKPVTEEKKEAYRKYLKELSLLHEMLVVSMKCKQTTDIEHIKTLHSLLEAFRKSYFGKK